PRDWRSDLCSSDLTPGRALGLGLVACVATAAIQATKPRPRARPGVATHSNDLHLIGHTLSANRSACVAEAAARRAVGRTPRAAPASAPPGSPRAPNRRSRAAWGRAPPRTPPSADDAVRAPPGSADTAPA